MEKGKIFLFFNPTYDFLIMSFKKIESGVIINYDNGYTVKLRVEGNKLHLKQERNGKTLTDSLFYLSNEQARQIKEALKNAKNADEVSKLLQGVMT